MFSLIFLWISINLCFKFYVNHLYDSLLICSIVKNQSQVVLDEVCIR